MQNRIWFGWSPYNESVDASGEYEARSYAPGTTETSQGYRTEGRAIKLKEIRITNKKETWIAGKAEVDVIVVRSINCDSVIPLARPPFIKKIANNQLNIFQFPAKELMVADNQAPYTLLADNEDMDVIMFEYDKYGTANEWVICSSPLVRVTWKSNDTRYGIAHAIGSNMPSSSSWQDMTASWGNDACRFLVKKY